MTEVNELKYLGFVVSSDATNMANISDKKNKSFSTIRSRTNIIALFLDTGGPQSSK